MALGGKVHDRLRPVLSQKSLDQTAIADIAANELIPGIRCDALQIVQVPRIRQFVQIYDRGRFVPHPVQDKVRPDEACPAGDKNGVSHSESDLLQGRRRTLGPWQDKNMIVIKKDGVGPPPLLGRRYFFCLGLRPVELANAGVRTHGGRIRRPVLGCSTKHRNRHSSSHLDGCPISRAPGADEIESAGISARETAPV
jgi:hypothetical protein